MYTYLDRGSGDLSDWLGNSIRCLMELKVYDPFAMYIWDGGIASKKKISVDGEDWRMCRVGE